MGSRDRSTPFRPGSPPWIDDRSNSTASSEPPLILETNPPIPRDGSLQGWVLPLPPGIELLPQLEIGQPMPIPAALETDPEAMALQIAGLEVIAGEHERRLRDLEGQIWTLMRRL